MHPRIPRLALIVIVLVAFVLAVALAGCGAEARQDAETSGMKVDRSPAEVLAMPNAFRNVATKCNGHGHRVFSSSNRGLRHRRAGVRRRQPGLQVGTAVARLLLLLIVLAAAVVFVWATLVAPAVRRWRAERALRGQYVLVERHHDSVLSAAGFVALKARRGDQRIVLDRVNLNLEDFDQLLYEARLEADQKVGAMNDRSR